MDDGTKEMKAKLLNLIAKGKIARETQANIECCQSHDRGCLPCGIGVYQTGSRLSECPTTGVMPLYIKASNSARYERRLRHTLAGSPSERKQAHLVESQASKLTFSWVL